MRFSKQIVLKNSIEIKVTVIESIPNKKVVFRLSPPLSFICSKLEWQIEEKESNSIFTAITHYKFGRLFLKLNKKGVDKILETTKKHTKKGGGENLKNILENNYETKNTSR